MVASEITREDLISSLQRANRELLKLRSHPQSFAYEMYDLPENPTPNHITRMLDDLAALADDASRGDLPTVVWQHYDRTVEHLTILRDLLYRASAPPDPFEPHR